MKRLGLALAFCLSLTSSMLAQGGMGPGPGMVHSTGGSGCSQATAFLARTSGLDGTHTTAYTDLICGLVTDGLITGTMAGSGSGATACGSKFDVLYIFATQDSTTALLNLCSTTFSPASPSGGLTFTADRGYQAISTNNISTGFNPTTATSANYVQNTAHLSVWNNTNGTTTGACMGNSGTTNLYPKFTDNNMYGRVTDNVASTGYTISNPMGLLVANRSASNAIQSYQNGSSLGTAAQAVGSLVNANILILSSPSAGNCSSTMQISSASIGGSLNSTEVSNYYSRMRTYMTAVGVP